MTSKYTADQVWAAATRACRLNDNHYLRNDEWLPDENQPGNVVPGRRSNKSLMLEGLKDLTLLNECDYEEGKQARNFFSKQFTFKALRSELNGFQSKLVECISLKEFDTKNSTALSVIASQIPRWKVEIFEETLLKGTINQPLATVGERISRDITVVRTVWSEKYQLNFITARTSCDHVVFFAFRAGKPQGYQCRIQGTVKAHRQDSTQLNRVKLFDL